MFRASKPLLIAAASAAIGLAGAARAGAQETIAPKYREDSRATVRSTTKLEQTMTIMGMEIETSVDQESVSSREIGKRNEDGSLPITTKVDTLKASMSLPGGNALTFDSSAPPPKEEDPQMSMIVDILQAMVGTSYTTILDKQNKPMAIQGAAEALDRIRNTNPEAAEAVESRLNAETLKKEEAESLARYPEKPVAPGASWTRTETMPLEGGQTMTFDKTYTYAGPVEKDGKTLHKIDMKTTGVKFAINNPQLKAENVDLKVASSDGFLLFDPEAGEFVEEVFKVQIQGTLTLSVQGQSLDTELDLSMERTQTVEQQG